jgi:hypothetical protein
VLWVCRYGGDNNLIVVDAKSICSGVSMPPFPPPPNPEDSDLDLYFIDEDLGLDVADLDPLNAADGIDDDVSSHTILQPRLTILTVISTGLNEEGTMRHSQSHVVAKSHQSHTGHTYYPHSCICQCIPIPQ